MKRRSVSIAKQKVAVITGSGQGIALRLANDGFTVVINDINNEVNDIKKERDTARNLI